MNRQNLLVMKAARQHIRASVFELVAMSCPYREKDGKPDLSRMDPPMKPYYDQTVRLLRRMDAAILSVVKIKVPRAKR